MAGEERLDEGAQGINYVSKYFRGMFLHVITLTKGSTKIHKKQQQHWYLHILSPLNIVIIEWGVNNAVCSLLTILYYQYNVFTINLQVGKGQGGGGEGDWWRGKRERERERGLL